MEELKLIVAPSPHIRDEDSTSRMMFNVLVALVPVLAGALYFFRWDALRLVVLGGAAAVATEAVFQSLRKKPVTVGDGSALITGVLLGLIVPPQPPQLDGDFRIRFCHRHRQAGFRRTGLQPF